MDSFSTTTTAHAHAHISAREDDFVECFLFFEPGLSLEDKVKISAGVKEEVSKLSGDHLWHKDRLGFQLVTSASPAVSSPRGLPDHIYGVCHFGENIQDEWLVVYAVKRITLRFPQLAARVVDVDGEFLLIEAADFLPDWATPDDCDNRVYIKEGRLHLIPPDDPSNVGPISIEEGLRTIFGDRERFSAPPEIANPIETRISEYPGRMKSDLHSVNVYAPLGVAEVLRMRPSLISAAIHALLRRDPADEKICRAMKHFPPEARVVTRITFTRCLYAMLLHHRYDPDGRVGWNLPSANSPQYKSHALGAKLACGFEILASSASSDGSECGKGFRDYIESLNRRGYFRDFLDKSEAHDELFAKAKEYYEEYMENVNVDSVVGKKVLDLLNEKTLDVSDYRAKEPLLPDDDDDGWLELNASELEAMLEKRYGKTHFRNVADESEPGEFTGKVNEFLEHLSSVDGAEFPKKDKVLPISPKRGVKTNKNSSNFNKIESKERTADRMSEKIELDPETFTVMCQNILDLVIPDDDWDLDSGSEPSHYGSDSDDLEKDMIDLKNMDLKSNKKNFMEEYMDQMDAELSGSTLAKSFEKVQLHDSEIIDINVNALKNIVESYKSEMGGSGPAGNLLGPLGYTNYELLSSIEDDVD